MEVFAWTGVCVAGVLVLIWLGAFLWGMVRSEIGRGILLGLSIVAVAVWGLLGGVYLLWKD